MLDADLVLAAHGSRFRLPEASLAVFVTGGLTATLPAFVGLARAKALMLLGEEFAAAQAHAWGLVWQLVPGADLEAAAHLAASRLRPHSRPGRPARCASHHRGWATQQHQASGPTTFGGVRPHPSRTHRFDMHHHRFTDSERRLLLSEPGIGPQVVRRIEASGVYSIRELGRRGAGSVVDTVCESLGSKAWANRRDALARVIARAGAVEGH